MRSSDCPVLELDAPGLGHVFLSKKVARRHQPLEPGACVLHGKAQVGCYLGREDRTLLKYVLDERPPNWFPNFQRLSFALALSEFCREPGERLRALIDGSLALDTVDAHQPPPDDLEGERAHEAFTLAVTRNLAAVQSGFACDVAGAPQIALKTLPDTVVRTPQLTVVHAFWT